MTDRSDLLMTYTTFHIGVYLTLGGGGIALLKTAGTYELLFAILCFFVAGVAGGVIGSNLPEFNTFDEFRRSKIGFWGWKPFNYDVWVRVEHAAFWIGLIYGVAILLLRWPPSDG